MYDSSMAGDAATVAGALLLSAITREQREEE